MSFDTCIYLRGVTCTQFFSVWHNHDLSFGLISIISPSSELGIAQHFLNGFLVLQGIFCQIFKFFSQLSRPVLKVLVKSEFIGAGSNMEHLDLFRSYLCHPNSELCIGFFLWTPCSSRNIRSKFQIFSRVGPQSFNSDRIHRSMFEYGALGLVSIISPSSELGMAHRFFNGLLVLQEIFYQNFKFFLNRLDRSSKFQFSHNLLEHV